MKKIILTILFAAIALLNYAQENNAVQPTDAEFLSKAKRQKTAAWICVGAGGALVIAGIASSTAKVEDDLVSVLTLSSNQHSYGTENFLLIVGGAALITSIPLFIASSKNSLKGRLMIANQKTAFGVPKAVSKNITGLTLTISL